MKKSCDGCRAIGKSNNCSLGYRTKMLYIPIPAFGNRMLERMVPLEQCPKPKTYDEYLLQKKLKIKEE